MQNCLFKCRQDTSFLLEVIIVLVYDYDHNAPSPDYLAETHERLYNTFRSKQPLTPIIMISKPDFDSANGVDRRRRAIIMETYLNALKRQDENVYFIDGETLFGLENRDCCTVDGCHPNDLGFERMATAIGRVLEKILIL